MRRLALLFIASVALFAQSSSKVTIIPPQTDANTGSVDFREKYANGQNYVGLQAPDSISSSFRLKLPSALPSVNGSCLTVSTAGVITTSPVCASPASYTMTDTNWSQTISTSMSPAGTYTITLTPAPLGVSAAITDSQYRLTGSPGAAELVSPTGVGTCDGTVQASCTIQFTTVNSHSAGATIASATKGLQEAWNAGRTSLNCPDGLHYFYATARTGARDTSVRGTPNCIIAPASNDLTLIHANSIYATHFYNIAFNSVGTTGLTAVKLGTSTLSNGNSTFESIRFTGGAYGIDARSGHELQVTGCIFYQDTSGGSAIRAGSVIHGDYFAGWYATNTFIGSWASGIELKANGAIISQNAFNGPGIHINFENWTAIVNTNGTTVTYVSGDKFNLGWTGTIQINGVLYVIASVDSDTQITLTGSAGTQSSKQFRHGTTGQLLISQNGNDSGTITDTAISLVGTNYFYGVRIEGNRCSQWYNTSTSNCVYINMPTLSEVVISNNNYSNALDAGTSNGINIVDALDVTITGNSLTNYDAPLILGKSAAASTKYTVTGNSISCNVAATTSGALISASNSVLTGNSFENCDTAVTITGAATYAIQHSHFVNNTARYSIDALATGSIADIEPLTYALIPANLGNGSVLYCSDCKPLATSNTCTSGGIGATVFAVQGVLSCRNIGAGGNFVFGGNTFGTEGLIGTNDNYSLQFKTNNTTHWIMSTAGTLTASTDGGPSIGADGANRPLNGYFAGILKSATYGTATNCSSAASPAVCSSASAGSSVVAAGATTVVVNTTAVTANSQIFITLDSSLGSKLSVTCNTGTSLIPFVTARTAATSFTVTLNGAPVTNPACFSWRIVN